MFLRNPRKDCSLEAWAFPPMQVPMYTPEYFHPYNRDSQKGNAKLRKEHQCCSRVRRRARQLQTKAMMLYESGVRGGRSQKRGNPKPLNFCRRDPRKTRDLQGEHP